MSKDPKDLQHLSGEFVGISLLSESFINKLSDLVEEDIDSLSLESYDTYGIVHTADYLPVHCLIMQDLIWSEIDTYETYLHAIEIF